MNLVSLFLRVMAVSCIVALALAFALGGVSPIVAVVSLIAGVTVGTSLLYRERNSAQTGGLPRGWEWVAVVAFALFVTRSFGGLVYEDAGEIRVLSRNNLFDLTGHWSFIRYLASGVPFWPENPMRPGVAFTYPMGVDFFNSLLEAAGVGTIAGLVAVGLAGATCTGVALWRWGGAFALLAVLFNGGTVVFENWAKGDRSWANHLADFAWNSLPLSQLVTQRGFLFALPAGLVLLDCWRTRFLGVPQTGWQPGRRTQLFLYAVMPLFHIHTFLFLSAMLAWWFVWVRPARRELLVFVAMAVIPASVLVWCVTGGFAGKSTVAWNLGWTWERPDEANPGRPSFLRYFFSNFGILPVLWAWLVVVLFRQREKAALHVVLPALVVFVLCFLVRFAPWSWDNSKLVLWCYVATLPALWKSLLSRWHVAARAVAFVALFTSGFVSVVGDAISKERYTLINAGKLAAVRKALAPLPVTERFAVAPGDGHAVHMSGRKIALGSPFTLWSHGLGDDVQNDALKALMNGAPDWRAMAAKLSVRYLFWSDEERGRYPDSTQAWRAESKVVASGEGFEIFDLSVPR